MDSGMDAGRAESRSLTVTTVWWIANFGLLVFLSLFFAERHDAQQSATPVADGALMTLLVVEALAIANGVLLCLSPRTRWLGFGVLLGAAVALFVGFGITLGFLGGHLA